MGLRDRTVVLETSPNHVVTEVVQHVVVNCLWSTRASSANQRSPSGEVPRSGVGGSLGGVHGAVNYHNVPLEESYSKSSAWREPVVSR